MLRAAFVHRPNVVRAGAADVVDRAPVELASAPPVVVLLAVARTAEQTCGEATQRREHRASLRLSSLPRQTGRPRVAKPLATAFAAAHARYSRYDMRDATTASASRA